MAKDNLLTNIPLPSGIKKLSFDEMEALCDDIRRQLIHTVSKNGGHLASNLGTVELTVALHRVFDFPNDQVVWDVGHQSYTHKLLTGRLDGFDTIRLKDGISGFPKRYESAYDAFGTGHSSTSISAALGLAEASVLQGADRCVMAVIGDGALSGGLAYEGLNNAGRFPGNFIVILNDNKMSISRGVGSMARYLSSIRTKNLYLRFKGVVDRGLPKVPLIGKPLKNLIRRSKSVLKDIIYKGTLFEDMGFTYYGLIDGHDLKSLIRVFKVARESTRPIFIHLSTIKGKGYEFAEKDPRGFHGTAGFDVETGEPVFTGDSFSKIFGDTLCELAGRDERICAITAAMKEGTGLRGFASQFGNRFFDVGIAEGHAVTFASGLAAGGMIPVFAVYSTFLQRSYDQLIHDAAIQNLHVVLAVDRAGIVGDDGETHQGLFDVAFMNSIPNLTIYAPTYYDELKDMMHKAVYDCDGVAAVRFPRGQEPYRPNDFHSRMTAFDLYDGGTSGILIVAYGRLFAQACVAREALGNKGLRVSVLKLNRIKPVSRHAVRAALPYQRVFFFEEGMKIGGVGESFLTLLTESGYSGKLTLRAVDDIFVGQATCLQALEECGLDARGMQACIEEEIASGTKNTD